MSKKPTGDARKKGGAGKPVPSDHSQKTRNLSPPKGQNGRKGKNVGAPHKERSKQKAKPSPVRNRPAEPEEKKGRSQLALDGDSSYDDAFRYPDLLDKDAENVLKKPQRESSLLFVKPLPPAKAPSSPYKRKVKRILFYAATLLVLVSVCIVLSLTVFFKIDSISVEGETRYSKEDIIASCMIEPGDNLILCNTSPGESEIWRKFPYIESVTIRKKLFNRIVINVQEAVPTSMIESQGKYVLLSESGKIIDIFDKKQTDVPIIMGAKLNNPRLSSSISYQDSSIESFINEILSAADRYGFGVLKTIDISNLSKITLEHKKGLHIILGTPENIDYKMKTAMKILQKGVSEEDGGTLDVSLSASEGGKSYFRSQKTVKQESSSESSTGASSQESATETSEAETDIGHETDPETNSGEEGTDTGDTPDDNIPDDNIPDDNTPDDNTPDDNTPDDNTPDDNTPDDGVWDDQTGLDDTWADAPDFVDPGEAVDWQD